MCRRSPDRDASFNNKKGSKRFHINAWSHVSNLYEIIETEFFLNEIQKVYQKCTELLIAFWYQTAVILSFWCI